MGHESPEPDTTILDAEDLAARCLGNLEFVERVLAKFQEQGDADLEKLEQAMVAGDAEQVASLAHRLKGASANASASRLRARAEQLEQVARTNELAGMPECLTELRGEWKRFRSAAAQHTSSTARAT